MEAGWVLLWKDGPVGFNCEIDGEGLWKQVGLIDYGVDRKGLWKQVRLYCGVDGQVLWNQVGLVDSRVEVRLIDCGVN